MQQHARFLLTHFGDAFPLEDLSQTGVDAFAAARRAGTLRAQNRATGPQTVRDGTIRQNLNWLAALLRWARGHRVQGRRLLATNPLDGLTLLPREKNVRRPVASEARYQATLAAAPHVDPTGRLAGLLALARFTGRRVTAFASLGASDVALSAAAVKRALARGGEDARRAEHMPHGAIRWRAETDKLDFEELTPLSRGAREALDAYLRAQLRVGDVPLFPDTLDATQPMGTMDAAYLLTRAESHAGLEKLSRGLWHPYRRLWASERKHLPDPDVAKAGGWRDLATMKTAYQQPDLATTLAVIENAPPAEVSKPASTGAAHE